jgi:hydrogenase maturation protein HypF
MSELIGFAAGRVAADPHPAYRSHRIARDLAAAREIPLDLVLHHHAHAASAMVEHGLPLDHPPILALALDGLGLGEDGALWGAELLSADYRTARRLGGLAPTALLGGDRAAREPWRNLAARLDDAFGDDLSAWPAPLRERLAGKQVATMLAARRAGINAPPASSAGRLFDAVAAAVGLCADCQDYEGEAAMRLQAAAESAMAGTEIAMNAGAGRPYVPTLAARLGGLVLDPAPLWPAISGDLAAGVPAGVIAARFHAGLAGGLCALLAAARDIGPPAETVALTGGTFQNALLARLVRERLQADGLSVIEHGEVPANDGGQAVGQAAVAIARTLS